MNTVSASQTSRFFLAFSPMAKLLFLPPLLALQVGQDLWISLALCFLLDAGLLILILGAGKRGATFVSVTQGAFGKVGSKILCALYLPFFFGKTFLFFGEEGRFVTTELFETVPFLVFLLPLFSVGIFLAVQKVRSIGRLSDIFFFISLISLAALFLFALPEGKWQALLPVAFRNGKPIFLGALNALLYFGDPLYLFFLLGSFSVKEREGIKIFSGFLLSALTVLLFSALFYAIFSVLARFETAAYYNIAKYGAFSTSAGRIDLAFSYLLRGVSAVALSLPGYFAVYALCRLWGIQKQGLCACAFFGSVFLALCFTYSALGAISEKIRLYGGIAALVLQYALPAYALIFFLLRTKSHTLSDTRNGSEKTDAAYPLKQKENL